MRNLSLPSLRFLVVLTGLVLVEGGCAGLPGTTSDESTGEKPRANDLSAGPRASPAQPPSADEHAAVGTHSSETGRLVFELTNEARTERGRSLLREDTTLARIACWHNQDMLAHDYLGHEDAEGRLPGDRAAHEHRRLIGSVGENVYERSGRSAPSGGIDPDAWATTIVDGWMESPGHRANILRSQFTHLGTCVTHTASSGRATQLFANVGAYLDEPLPWSVSPGDSVSVSVTVLRGGSGPDTYAFVPAGEALDEAFRGGERERSFDGSLHFPKTPGVYGSRFLFPAGKGRYTVLSGPRVSVE